mgnify:FL=1
MQRPSECSDGLFYHQNKLNFTCVYLLAASAIFFAILVAPTVKPDMPIKEAAANLINVFILTLFCVFKGVLCIFLFVGISHIVGDIGCADGQAGHTD